MSRVQTPFRLQVDAAATPERVAAAAAFLGRVLRAAHPALPEGSVTLVIHNLHMDAEVRARTPEAREAAREFLAFLKNPSRALERAPKLRTIAEALAGAGDELLGARILRSIRGEPLAVLDELYTRRMRALALAAVPRDADLLVLGDTALRGTTVVYSPIYRVGRWDDDGAFKARIRLDGEMHEIALVDHASLDDFFKAVATKRIYPVYMQAAWRRGEDNRLHYDLKKSRIARIDLTWTPATGAEFVTTFDAVAPSGYVDEDDVEERVAEIRRRQA